MTNFATPRKVAGTVAANGTLAKGKHTPADATAGALTLTLPTGANEGSHLSVEKVDTSTNTVTVTGNIRGVGGSTLSLAWQYESITLSADAAGSWWPVAGHKTKTSIDRADRADAWEGVLRSEFMRSKGGAIGTSGRPAVALRYDHGLNNFGATILPLLTARGLPSGICLFSQMLQAGAQGYIDDNNYTFADVENWCIGQGVEVWAHGDTHLNATTREAIYHQIVTSKADLEAAMPKVKIQGWMQPGVANPAYNDLVVDDVAGFRDSYAGQLLRQTYPVIENDSLGPMRYLPTGPTYGMGHETTDAQNITQLKAIVDFAIAFRLGVEFMTHPALLGVGSNTSVADYTAFLDYLVTQRDAGLLDILTPSGLYAADPERTTRANLLVGGDFDNGFDPVTNPGRWETTSAHTLVVDPDGTKWLQLDATHFTFSQGNAYAGWAGFSGETWCVEMKVRRVADVAVAAYIKIQDDLNTAYWQDQRTFAVPSSTTGTVWRSHFTIPKGTRYPRLYFGHSTNFPIQVTGIKVYKV